MALIFSYLPIQMNQVCAVCVCVCVWGGGGVA